MNIVQHLHDTFVPNARNSYRPHALGQRPLAVYAGILATVKILSLLSFGTVPQTFAAGVVNETSVIALTNQSRAGYNLKPVHENPLLDQAATKKAADMLASQYFAHTSPSGVTPWDFIKAAGYNYIIAGENLAVNFYNADGLQNAWMNSPEHKANILNKDFQDIGVGIAQGQFHGAPAIFVVEMFGTPSEQQISVQHDYTKVLAHPPVAAMTAAKITLPDSKMIALAQPAITSKTYALTDNTQFQLSGDAAFADRVYAIVNNQPVAELSVSEGQFNGVLNLAEGTNIIRVVAYYGKYVSNLSNPITINVDTTAPKIVDSDLNPEQQTLKVQVDGSAVKVVASLGGENVMLQPTSDPNIWEGKFAPLQGEELQGNLRVVASDMAGNTSIITGATLTPNLQSTYAFASQPQSHQLNPFYVYFFLAIMLGLAIAIGVRRDIQHVGLIAQVSALAAFAILLYVS